MIGVPASWFFSYNNGFWLRDSVFELIQRDNAKLRHLTFASKLIDMMQNVLHQYPCTYGYFRLPEFGGDQLQRVLADVESGVVRTSVQNASDMLH